MSADHLSKEKRVIYRFLGCKQDVVRVLPVAKNEYKSYCSTAGKDITMQRQSWSYIKCSK